MPGGSSRSFRTRDLLPHVVLIFTFSCYIFLGACGLYFLVFPSSPTTGDDEPSESGLRPKTDQGQEFIEMHIDIPCSEAKKRLEELDRLKLLEGRKIRLEDLKKYNFTRAILVCFNWITTIGNRLPAEWEYIDSPIPAISGGLINKFYAIAYMLLGIPLTFLTLGNFAALLYDALNALCFAVRRRWRAKMVSSRSGEYTQIRRDVEESRLWNPLWFIFLLIAYLFTGAALLQHIWSRHDRSIFLAEAIWNCATLIFAIGETSRDIFVFPPTAGYCFVQIAYSIFGLIIFGAFLRSFLPLADRVYLPKVYRIKTPAPSSPRPKVKKRQHILRRQDEGSRVSLRGFPISPRGSERSLRRTRSKESPLVTPKAKRNLPPIPPIPASPPRSILRQRNGVGYSFEPRRDSFESQSTDDIFFSPMVRFAMPSPPDEPPPEPPTIRHEYRRPDLEIQTWSREPIARPWSSERNLAPVRPAFAPRRLGPVLAAHMESQNSLVFSVSPESIPYMDDRNSTLIN